MNKQEAKKLVKDDIRIHRLESEAVDVTTTGEKRAELLREAAVLRNDNEALKRQAGVRMNDNQTDEYWEIIEECSESDNEDDWSLAIDKLISLVYFS